MTEAKLRQKIAAFIGDDPPSADHYTKKTIAAIQCISVHSRRRKPSRESPNTMMCKYFVHFRNNCTVLISIGLDVGNAFAFAHNYLFTTFHTINQEDQEFKVEGIYISDRLDPTKALYKLEVVGVSKELDIAVLRCRRVHLFRLGLRATSLQTFRTVYTVNCVESQIVTLHSGRVYPGRTIFMGRCDAPSAQGWSGGPLLDTSGQVIGMLKGTLGDVDRVFINTEGLLYALGRIKSSWGWRDWGIKAVLSEEGSIESGERRKREADDESRKRPPQEVAVVERKTWKLSKLAVDETDHAQKQSWRPTALVLSKLTFTDPHLSFDSSITRTN